MAVMSGNSVKAAPPPVHVALVAGARTVGHIGRGVRQLAIGLLDEPLRVTLVLPRSADLAGLPCPPAGRIDYIQPRFGHLRQRAVARMAAQLGEAGVEILHGLDGSAHALTRALSRRGDWPYLVSALSLRAAGELSTLGRHCRAILAASLPIRTDLLNHRVAPAEKILLVRPGVHRLRQAPSHPGTECSWSILAAGVMDSAEPFATILRAFAIVRQRRPDCVLFLLGQGRAEHRLRLLVQSLDLAHQVTFVDRLGEAKLAGVFQAADLFVYPASRGELEMEVLTAMAAGVAVLTGGACVGDFAIDGETVWSYPPGDSADLARKLGILMGEPDDAIHLTTAALAYLAENHSPARIISSLAALYRDHALPGRTLQIP